MSGDRIDLGRIARRKTVELTTRGRRSGQLRKVKIWFVVAENAVLVQHIATKPAHWYRNLCADGNVQVDFGDGPLAGRAEPILDREKIESVVAQIGRKYWTYRIIRFFGGDVGEAVAARIVVVQS